MALNVRREEATTLVQRLRDSLGGGGQYGGKRNSKSENQVPDYGNRSVHLRHGKISEGGAGDSSLFPGGGKKKSLNELTRVKSSSEGREGEEETSKDSYKTTQVIDVDILPPKSLIHDTLNGKWKPNLGLGVMGRPNFLRNDEDADTLEDLDSLKSATGAPFPPSSTSLHPPSSMYQTLMSINLGQPKNENERIQQQRRFSTNLPPSAPVLEIGEWSLTTKRPHTQQNLEGYNNGKLSFPGSGLSSASSDSKLTIDDDTHALCKDPPTKGPIGAENPLIAGGKAGLPWFLCGLFIGIGIMGIIGLSTGGKDTCGFESPLASELYQPNHNSTKKGKIQSEAEGGAKELEILMNQCRTELIECKSLRGLSTQPSGEPPIQNGSRVGRAGREETDDNLRGKDDYDTGSPGNTYTTATPTYSESGTGGTDSTESTPRTRVSEITPDESTPRRGIVTDRTNSPGEEDSTTKVPEATALVTTTEGTVAVTTGSTADGLTGTNETTSESVNLEAENLHDSNPTEEPQIGESNRTKETRASGGRALTPPENAMSDRNRANATTMSSSLAGNDEQETEIHEAGTTAPPTAILPEDTTPDGASSVEENSGDKGTKVPGGRVSTTPANELTDNPQEVVTMSSTLATTDKHGQMYGRVTTEPTATTVENSPDDSTPDGVNTVEKSSGAPVGQTSTTPDNKKTDKNFHDTTTTGRPIDDEYTETNTSGSSESPALVIGNLRKATTEPNTRNESDEYEQTTLKYDVTSGNFVNRHPPTGRPNVEEEEYSGKNRKDNLSADPAPPETNGDEHESATLLPGQPGGLDDPGISNSKAPENPSGNYETKPTTPSTLPTSVAGLGNVPPGGEGTIGPRRRIASRAEPPPTDSGGSGSGGGKRKKQKGWFQRLIEVVKDVISTVTPFQVRSRDDGNLDIAVH